MSSEFNSLQISSAKQATKFAVETCTEGVPCKMMIWLEAKQMQTGQILAGVANTHSLSLPCLIGVPAHLYETLVYR
jgi:hypothetical protein